MLQKGLPEFKAIVFLVAFLVPEDVGERPFRAGKRSASRCFASLSYSFSSFPLPSQKRVPVSRRRAVLSHYTLRCEGHGNRHILPAGAGETGA